MDFDIIDEITKIETIVKGPGIREINWLRKYYGDGNLRKMKGIANIRVIPGEKTHLAELHWYEAHGIGKRKLNEKDIRVIDESGEDYLYPSSYFIPIRVPHSVEESLLNAL